VADFTYVPLDGGGFGYTAFVIDAFAGLIAGWECALTKNTAFVERAIRQATAYRARQGHRFTGDTIHHSDYAEVCFKPRMCGDGLRSWRLLVDFSA
jgi:transposase InsO family protein